MKDGNAITVLGQVISVFPDGGCLVGFSSGSAALVMPADVVQGDPTLASIETKLNAIADHINKALPLEQSPLSGLFGGQYGPPAEKNTPPTGSTSGPAV